MAIVTFSEFILGDTLVRYLTADGGAGGQIGLSLVPLARRSETVAPRVWLDAPYLAHLPARWQPLPAGEIFPLVHVQRQGEPVAAGFAQGRTLLGGPTTLALRFVEQECLRENGGTCVRTQFATHDGLAITHELHHGDGDLALRVRTHVRNDGAASQTLVLFTSFALGGITPFASDDAPERLWVHRFRSAWSAEGRHEERRVEDCNLERSWSGYGVRGERFGQVGSMPTNGFFPRVAVEDRVAGVCWGAQLAHPGSWQLELYRRGDQVGVAGGLADRDFGHWTKHLAPGESLATPEAMLAVAEGGVDDVCDRLSEPLRQAFGAQPREEQTLPVIFNEWCTSWGAPTHDNLIALAERLRGSGVRYLVIDDGWAERPGDGSQQNGDWILNRAAFPHGLMATADAIRARGLIPGIWFEFEAINLGARAWNETAHQLQRDGVPLQVGTRRFWDFRDPWVHDFLAERVIGLLRDNGLGYLKVDYNDTIGTGCDGAESPGEGLRQHLEGVQRFFRRLRAELPELVIENCSSGGHRAEPSMMALTAMTSFSDAHESPDIPVIAANLHRLAYAAQSQIWAVLRKSDTPQRLSYSLAAAFLGRMCLSGDVHELSDAAWQMVRDAIRHYRAVAPLIAAGTFRRYGAHGPAYQHLRGWQAVVCAAASAGRVLIVWHAFASCPERGTVPLPAERTWRIADEFCDEPSRAWVDGAQLTLPLRRAWSGGVLVLEAVSTAAQP